MLQPNLKMKIGPDGSLCRITSSAKDLFNNVRIVKVPGSEPSYELQIIRPIDEPEELSEESSNDELSDDEFFDIKFPSKNSEKEKVVETKVDKPHKPKETVSEGVMRGRDRKQHHRPRKYNKNNRYGRRNNFNNNSKNYKSLTTIEEMYNYGNQDFNASLNRDFNPPAKQDFNSPVNRDFNLAASRDFTSAASHHVAYNTDNYQHTSDDFSPPPWLNPPVMLPYSCAPFSLPRPEIPRNSVGLLGDHPSYAPSLQKFQSNERNTYNHEQNSTYTPMAAKFQSKTKNDKFIGDQTLSYPPMASNNHDNSFVHKQSYWKNNYGNYNKNKRNWNQTSRRHQKISVFSDSCFQ